eukprot:CAMPEP_0185720406 /NCGR_PEP_ID=MMETSP1164-20130828/50100_1 /TAXON_ID=1104430 /ORGANISM="Chrysoreinhardia sp, Strain CCMP2950" /LENGTH=462 /DNA_ID=CAMNT_0028388069 /DNA_START=64 /DNA_END=1454 /DNA_ORIENTATION=-
MCLWFYNELREGRCLCPALDCAACGLLCVVLGPLGSLVGLVAGLGFGLLKWLPGSYQRAHAGADLAMIGIELDNCVPADRRVDGGVLRRPARGPARVRRRGGPRAAAVLYLSASIGLLASKLVLNKAFPRRLTDTPAWYRRRRPQAPRAPPASMTQAVGQALDWELNRGRPGASSSKCAAELYCCCFPCFVASQALVPAVVLIDLILCVAIGTGLCGGLGVGCGPGRGFVDRIADHVRTIDRRSSVSAFGTQRLWGSYPCLDAHLPQQSPHFDPVVGSPTPGVGGASPPADPAAAAPHGGATARQWGDAPHHTGGYPPPHHGAYAPTATVVGHATVVQPVVAPSAPPLVYAEPYAKREMACQEYWSSSSSRGVDEVWHAKPRQPTRAPAPNTKPRTSGISEFWEPAPPGSSSSSEGLAFVFAWGHALPHGVASCVVVVQADTDARRCPTVPTLLMSLNRDST